MELELEKKEKKKISKKRGQKKKRRITLEKWSNFGEEAEKEW